MLQFCNILVLKLIKGVSFVLKLYEKYDIWKEKMAIRRDWDKLLHVLICCGETLIWNWSKSSMNIFNYMYTANLCNTIPTVRRHTRCPPGNSRHIRCFGCSISLSMAVWSWAVTGALLLLLCLCRGTEAVECPDPKCTCTKGAISCPNVGLDQVPTFQDPDSSVNALVLDGNNISSIPEKAFSKLPNVNLISLLNNPLVNIHPAAFEGTNRINHLKLSRPNFPAASSATAQFNLTNIVHQLPELRQLEVTRLRVGGLDANFAHRSLNVLFLNDVNLLTSIRTHLRTPKTCITWRWPIRGASPP